MKKLLLALAFLIASPVVAQVHHDVIYERCVDEHKRGVCRALIDKKDYPPGAKRFIVGRGFVSFDAYVRIRNAGNSMCTVARGYCALEPKGDECFEAQLLWARGQ